jgi:hypothetical protein
MNEPLALALILSAPLAIPAMVWFCWAVEMADIINHPERHPYLTLAWVQDVTYSGSTLRRSD